MFLSIAGKDITHKLYSVSEGLGIAGVGENDGVASHLTRSASVDAVHEGARGRLRSLAWRARTAAPKGDPRKHKKTLDFYKKNKN